MYKPKLGEEAKYNPEGTHIYAVQTDKKTKETYAVRLTHVYEPKKEKKIKSGQLMVLKLPNVEFPSGVTNRRTTKDVNGKPLDLKTVQAVNLNSKKATYLSKSQADKINKFSEPKKADKKRKHR